MAKPLPKELRLPNRSRIGRTLFEEVALTTSSPGNPIEKKKLLGQFATPEPVAHLMAQWIGKISPKSVLDAGTGTGILARAVLQVNPSAHITAIDLDPECTRITKHALTASTNHKVVTADFLTWPSSDEFDAIISNPPYVRHHDLNYDYSIHDLVAQRSRTSISKAANAYILFILECCRRLRPGGRAAIIVPGEWVNANFGQEFKEFLAAHTLLRKLIYFEHANELFGDALTTSSILLIEKVRTAEPVEVIYFGSESAPISELFNCLETTDCPSGIRRNHYSFADLLTHPRWEGVLSGTWTPAPAGFVQLRELATTSRGIATGANDFFMLSAKQAEQRKIGKACLRSCISKAGQVSGLVFTNSDWEQLRISDSPCYLLDAHAAPTTESVNAYLKSGEELGLPKRFLLKSRRPWYKCENRTPSPIWAAVFGRGRMRFVYNSASIQNLTAFHCVYPTNSDPLFCQALVVCLNSTLVQKLLFSTRRTYGGGLSKMEPADLLDIPIPDLRKVSEATLKSLADFLPLLDREVRSNEQSDKLWKQLDSLIEQCGNHTTPAS